MARLAALTPPSRVLETELTVLLYVDAQFASPYALSAFVSLRTKGISFEVMPLDLAASQNTTAEYEETSLTGRVPTLVSDGFAVSESSAIAEYLEELHPLPRLYPVNPQAKARARQVQAWLRSDLLALRQDRSTQVIFYGPIEEPLTPEGEVAAQKLLQAASSLLAHGEDHLFGDWCIAALDLAVMLNRLVLNGDPVPEVLVRDARRQWQLATVQEWLRFPRPAP